MVAATVVVRSFFYNLNLQGLSFTKIKAEAATVADLAALVAAAADTVEASEAAEESLLTPDLD